MPDRGDDLGPSLTNLSVAAAQYDNLEWMSFQNSAFCLTPSDAEHLKPTFLNTKPGRFDWRQA